MITHNRTITRLAALAGLAALAACDSSTAGEMGTVRLHLAASGTSTMSNTATLVGFSEVTSAIVTISAAELMPGHVSIPIDPTPFELIEPNADLPEGVTALLGAVPTLGEYEQLRLFVSSATITVNVNDVEQEFQFDEDSLVPSGQQTGIKVNFGGPIEVGPGSVVDLVAVIDVAESFVFQGPPDNPRDVSFKPVIHASTMAVPSIGGTVAIDIGTAPATPTSVQVKATLNGNEVSTTIVEILANETSTGYVLHFLPAPTADNPDPVQYVVTASAAIGPDQYAASAQVDVTAPVRVTKDLTLTKQ